MDTIVRMYAVVPIIQQQSLPRQSLLRACDKMHLHLVASQLLNMSSNLHELFIDSVCMHEAIEQHEMCLWILEYLEECCFLLRGYTQTASIWCAITRLERFLGTGKSSSFLPL